MKQYKMKKIKDGNRVYFLKITLNHYCKWVFQTKKSVFYLTLVLIAAYYSQNKKKYWIMGLNLKGIESLPQNQIFKP